MQISDSIRLKELLKYNFNFRNLTTNSITTFDYSLLL